MPVLSYFLVNKSIKKKIINMLNTGNKPKSRKSSEKENDRKIVNFAAVEGGNI